MNDSDIMLGEISQQCIKVHKEIEVTRVYMKARSTLTFNKLLRTIDHLEQTLIDLRNMPLYINGEPSEKEEGDAFILACTGTEIVRTDDGYETRLPLLLTNYRKTKLQTNSYMFDTVRRAIRDYQSKHGYAAERFHRVDICVEQVYAPDVKPAGLLDNDNLELRQTINLLKIAFLFGDDPINTSLFITASAGTRNMTVIRIVERSNYRDTENILCSPKTPPK